MEDVSATPREDHGKPHGALAQLAQLTDLERRAVQRHVPLIDAAEASYGDDSVEPAVTAGGGMRAGNDGVDAVLRAFREVLAQQSGETLQPLPAREIAAASEASEGRVAEINAALRSGDITASEVSRTYAAKAGGGTPASYIYPSYTLAYRQLTFVAYIPPSQAGPALLPCTPLPSSDPTKEGPVLVRRRSTYCASAAMPPAAPPGSPSCCSRLRVRCSWALLSSSGGYVAQGAKSPRGRSHAPHGGCCAEIAEIAAAREAATLMTWRWHVEWRQELPHRPIQALSAAGADGAPAAAIRMAARWAVVGRAAISSVAARQDRWRSFRKFPTAR